MAVERPSQMVQEEKGLMIVCGLVKDVKGSAQEDACHEYASEPKGVKDL
ncbi:MAG: hypothetical protein H3Z54_10100 [archaeon]|nr:hypothetical protein [archaeon]